MKKITLLLMLLIMTTGFAVASNGGFQDSTKKMSVSDALKMADNSYVSVQGNIVKKLTDDKYMFKDSTGSMTVEIDNDRWAGISANRKDTLILSGEIEKKLSTTCLDVDSVQKLSKK